MYPKRYTNILTDIAIMVKIIICAEMKTNNNLWVDKAILLGHPNK